jgi:hypothetical protein
LLASTKAVIGLLAEGRDWRGAKGILRHLESFVYERRIAERLDCVLAMGQMGSLWHSMCGISEDKIFPFGYFPAICDTEEASPSAAQSPCNVTAFAVAAHLNR